MKSVCKYCAQKEVGCDAPCADRRKQITERKERLKAIKAPHFGTQRETDELLAINAEEIGAAQPPTNALLSFATAGVTTEEALNGIERLMNLGIIHVPVKLRTGGWHYEPIRR